MKMLALLLAAAFSTCALAAQPDLSKLPPIVKSGLAAYKADGAQAAVNAWMVGSPIAQTDRPQNEVRSLREFEENYGAYQKFHLVRVVPISPTAQMVYVQLDYLNGPAFGKFLVFQSKEAWSVTSFVFGADPEALWGLSLFGSPDTLRLPDPDL